MLHQDKFVLLVLSIVCFSCSDCDSIFTSDPVCFAHVVTDFSKVEDNYLRGCKW